jgi:hypothetical protein
MSRLLGHPVTHGHHVNPYTCGSGEHLVCSGFSGGYDTYLCGCCCHDAPDELTDAERATVARMRNRSAYSGRSPT